MPLKKEDVKAALLDQLRAHPQLPFLREATDDAVNSMLGHREVKTIYNTLKEELNNANSVPDAFKDSGITADMWTYVGVVRASRAEARQQHAVATEGIAAEYARKVKELGDKLADSLALTDTPIIRIVELNFDNLPAAVVFKINAIEDSKLRADAVSPALLAARKRAIITTYAETPFSAKNESLRTA